MGPAPLMAPSAPSFLVMVSPDTSSTFAAASQASASEKPGKSNLEISQTPNRSQPQGDPDDTGTSCLSIHEDPGLDVVSLSGSGQEIVSASIAKPPDASGRKPAPPLPREGVTQSDSIARENPYQNPGQPAIWTRISEAFGIEDSDFGSIGSEPLEEPVEIDADELSAAVDRIIDGFAQPVEDSLGGPQFGKTVGMAAGLAIAVQIYVRRRRFMDESNGAEADERSELRTYVSPQLDQLDESDL
ncbi:hypothetical protein GC170_09860 [bacterium]|nr:hypothetical protein [bacterium]